MWRWQCSLQNVAPRIGSRATPTGFVAVQVRGPSNNGSDWDSQQVADSRVVPPMSVWLGRSESQCMPLCSEKCSRTSAKSNLLAVA